MKKLLILLLAASFAGIAGTAAKKPDVSINGKTYEVKNAGNRTQVTVDGKELVNITGSESGDQRDAIKPVGKSQTKTFSLNRYTAIDAGSVFRIYLDDTASGKVTVTADEAFMPYISVRVSNGKLCLSLTGTRGRNIYLSKGETIDIHVCGKDITGLDLSGACKATDLVGLSGNTFSLDMSGACYFESKKELSFSNMNLDLSGASKVTFKGTCSGRLDLDCSGATILNADITRVKKATIDCSGAAKVNLTGSASEMELDCSGAAIFHGEEFLAGDTVAECSGASHAYVNNSGKLALSASGAGVLTYKKGVSITSLSATGSSRIKGVAAY